MKKLKFGKLVYSKNQRKNHKINPTKANIILKFLYQKDILLDFWTYQYPFVFQHQV